MNQDHWTLLERNLPLLMHFNGTDHVMHCVRPELLDDVIRKTNDLSPDLIILAGDFIEYFGGDAFPLASRWLSKLRAHMGVFATIGNHDTKCPGAREQVISALHSAGITVLENERSFPVPCIELVGVGDFLTPGDFRPQDAMPPAKGPRNFRLVVSHNPDSVPELFDFQFDLICSGHIHGGQIVGSRIGPVIPWLRENVWGIGKLVHKIFGASVKHWEWASGLHELPAHRGTPGQKRWLYVTRGIGTHPPIRIGCPPEITVLRFVGTPTP